MSNSYWQKYLRWVEENPETATDIEKALKWISYLASGQSLSMLLNI